jgi:hypothetical protein
VLLRSEYNNQAQVVQTHGLGMLRLSTILEELMARVFGKKNAFLEDGSVITLYRWQNTTYIAHVVKEF